MKRMVTVVLLLAVSVASELAGQTRARTPDDYDDVFREYSKRFFGPGFDWRYFKAQGLAESNLAAGARSRAGARGIMQLMPSTYKAVQTSNPELQAIDDPESNIAAGIMYDRDLWRAYQDHTDEERLRFMFGGYNAGPGTMRRAKRVARSEQLDDSVAERGERRSESRTVALPGNAVLRGADRRHVPDAPDAAQPRERGATAEPMSRCNRGVVAAQATDTRHGQEVRKRQDARGTARATTSSFCGAPSGMSTPRVLRFSCTMYVPGGTSSP